MPLMDTFYGVVRCKDDGCIVYLTVLTRWEPVLREICAHWFLETPLVKVKYYIPYAHGTMSCISSEGDFMRMCDLHHMLKKNVVDMLAKEVSKVTDGTCRPSMAT